MLSIGDPLAPMDLFPENNLKSISDLQMTSKDGKALIPVLVDFLEGFQTNITKILTEMKQEFVNMGKAKDEEILSLRNEVKSLKRDFYKLEEKIEENEAYERRDTLIFLGKKLPVAVNGENCSQIVCKLLADNANLVVPSTDISCQQDRNCKLLLFLFMCSRHFLFLLEHCQHK